MSNRPKIKKKKVKKPKPLAIVGTGHGHQLAPTSGEVWVMNDLGCFRYCTMLWDVHNFDWTLEENYENYSHIQEDLTDEARWKRTQDRDARFRRIEEFCIRTGTALMSVKTYERVPNSIAYPLDEVIAFHPGCREFLNSALSHSIAYALYTGWKSIDLYGINVEMGTEWIYQRDCVSYWIGRAHGMGVRVTVSGSLRRPLRIIDKKIYGFDRIQKDIGVPKQVRMVNKMGQSFPQFVTVVDESEEEW